MNSYLSMSLGYQLVKIIKFNILLTDGHVYMITFSKCAFTLFKKII